MMLDQIRVREAILLARAGAWDEPRRVQVNMPPAMRHEITALSSRYDLSEPQMIRAVLDLGLRVLRQGGSKNGT
jgi:hypothetical protein